MEGIEEDKAMDLVEDEGMEDLEMDGTFGPTGSTKRDFDSDD